MSSFSETLSTLESLVLEVALEEAQQRLPKDNQGFGPSSHHGTTIKECEMSQDEYAAIAQLPGNNACSDCGRTDDTEWASVTFGILLCAECSGVHRALGTHISRVRSIKMDNWSKEHLDMMRVGGNQTCQLYLESHDVGFDEEIANKYSSKAAEDYKKLLKERAAAYVPEPKSTSDHNTPPLPCRMEETMDDSFACDDNGEHGRSQSEEALATPTATVESWFGKRRMPALRVSSGNGGSDFNSLQARRGYRRSYSSNSTPTITYMGRSFSADGSDHPIVVEQKKQGHLRSMSDIKLLAELSMQQEAIARENLNAGWRASWRQSAPASYWTTDKKVEPFQSSEYGYGSGEKRGGRRHRHNESMRQRLAYTDEDLLKIALDDDEFQRLKAGLKHKGAVTNEVLKQKLYAFVAKSKLRRSMDSSDEAKNGENIKQRRSARSPKPRSKKKSKSRDELRAKTIHTSTAKRL